MGSRTKPLIRLAIVIVVIDALLCQSTRAAGTAGQPIALLFITIDISTSLCAWVGYSVCVCVCVSVYAHITKIISSNHEYVCRVYGANKNLPLISVEVHIFS